jgi:hypothetical protein
MMGIDRTQPGHRAQGTMYGRAMAGSSQLQARGKHTIFSRLAAYTDLIMALRLK